MPREMLTVRWFAASYNWTPDQVLDLPLEYVEWFPVVERAQARADQLKADRKK